MALSLTGKQRRVCHVKALPLISPRAIQLWLAMGIPATAPTIRNLLHALFCVSALRYAGTLLYPLRWAILDGLRREGVRVRWPS